MTMKERRSNLSTDINHFIERIGKGAKIEDKGTVDNKSRKGVYIKLTLGLTYGLYFVGLDKINNTQIVEDTGQ